MNRLGITKQPKAMACTALRKARRSSTRRSPYKTLLVGIAYTGDESRAANDSEGSSGSSIHLVCCPSPVPLPESPASPSRTDSASPQPAKYPAVTTSAGEATGKKKHITPQPSAVLRLSPSHVAASTSHTAGSPLCHTPLDALTIPEAHPVEPVPREYPLPSPCHRANGLPSHVRAPPLPPEKPQPLLHL